MRAPRLLLTMLLPMIGGAIAGAIYRGGFFGGYSGMIGGLLLGVMVAAALFAVETLATRRWRLAPLAVGLVAAVLAFGFVRLAYQPPAGVIFRQTFGSPPPSVQNLHAEIRYAHDEHAILMRFEVDTDDLATLRAHRDLEPQPEDEPLDLDLSPFMLPNWWDLDPHAEQVDRYHTTIDFADEVEQYEDAPPMADEHVPAHHFFGRPGQLFYDREAGVAYYVDRSYWEAARE